MQVLTFSILACDLHVSSDKDDNGKNNKYILNIIGQVKERIMNFQSFITGEVSLQKINIEQGEWELDEIIWNDR